MSFRFRGKAEIVDEEQKNDPHRDTRIRNIKNVRKMVFPEGYLFDVDEIDHLTVKDPVNEVTHCPAPNQPQGEPLPHLIPWNMPLIGINNETGPQSDQDKEWDTDPGADIGHEPESGSWVIDVGQR